MGAWSARRDAAALSTTNDFMTLVSASARRAYVYLVEFAGMGTASAANSVQVARSSGGVTGGGAITAEPIGGEQAAVASVVNTTWTTQPTLDDVVKLLGVNANGGINRWQTTSPRAMIEVRNAATLSLRSATGTSTVSGYLEWDEP